MVKLINKLVLEWQLNAPLQWSTIEHYESNESESEFNMEIDGEIL
jgi:hypothetical protein